MSAYSVSGPATLSFLNDIVRTGAELGVAFYKFGREAGLIASSGMAELVQEGVLSFDSETGLFSAQTPATVINDGRTDGAYAFTAGQLAAVLNKLSSVVAEIDDDAALQQALAVMAVRRDFRRAILPD